MDPYYCRSRTGESGPFSRDELLFLLNSGRLSGDIQIRIGTGEPWIPIDQTEFARKSKSAGGPASKPAANGRFGEATASLLPATEPKAEPLPLDHSAPPHVKTLAGSDSKNHWITALITSGLVLLMMLFAIWFRSRQTTVGTESEQSSLAGSSDSQSTGGSSGSETERSEADVGVQPEEAESVSVAPEPVDEPVSSTDSPIDESQSKPREAVLAREPVDPAVAFRIRLPSKDELQFDADQDQQLPDHHPALKGSDLSGRSGPLKNESLNAAGGTPESEAAVARALDWLRQIQQPDGSWRFDSVGRKAQPGLLKSPEAATALAVLCFLGAGNTTSSGPDKKVVQRAFDFLDLSIKSNQRQNNTLYVDALVMMSFSELAAMDPADKRARKQAEALLTYIEDSQDQHGGGWRYRPRESGDLSVTGWQVMALQSGRTSGLNVSESTVVKASAFLDSVSRNGGSKYCYTPGSGTSDCMTAVGLLSRMYLGWPRNSPPLRSGLRELCKSGPDRNNIYLNYYATLAVHHFGGDLWEEWNPMMRSHLLSTQIQDGEAAGSWRVTDPHGMSGGQIYQTCLSVLCLEVYYRYLPMFGSPSTGEN